MPAHLHGLTYLKFWCMPWVPCCFSSAYVLSYESELCPAEHAWVPAGSHYMDKMTHEATSPSRPPNSPQGVQAPHSPSSQRPRSSSAHRPASPQLSPSKPRWDSWGFSKVPSEAGSALGPRQNPSRAALKSLAASWSPTRKGFMQPDLAKRNNGFSHANRQAASSQHAQSRQGSAKRVGKIKSGKAKQVSRSKMQHAPGTAATDGSKQAAPQSFLQPILHSNYQNAIPDDRRKKDMDTDSTHNGASQAKGGKPKKKSRGGRNAAQRAKAAAGNAENLGETAESTLPTVIVTDSQGQGSYNSPRQSPHRKLHNNSSPIAGDSSFIIMPASAHGSIKAPASDSSRSAQTSPSRHAGQHSLSNLAKSDCLSTRASMQGLSL